MRLALANANDAAITDITRGDEVIAVSAARRLNQRLLYRLFRLTVLRKLIKNCNVTVKHHKSFDMTT